MQYAQIILPLNLKGSFTYTVPEELVPQIQEGMRVLVPFRGKKIYTGVVFELHHNTPEGFLAKDIISILDEQPIVPEAQLKFWSWLSDYYLCGLGEIYRFAFPSSLKLESETYLKLKPNAIVDFENLDVNEMYLVQALEVRQLINLTDIEAFIPKKDIIRTINSLIDLQYIEIDEKIAEKYKAKEVAYVKVRDEIIQDMNLMEVLLKLNRAAKQKELFLMILEKQTENPGQPIRKSDLFEDGFFASSHFKALADKNLVEEYYLRKDRLESYQGDIEGIEELSEAQKKAKTDIDAAFEAGKNVLLHGVTSSGKTHIYLEKIEECIQQDKNVLFLLPETSLAKQIIQRLEKKYGRLLGFYHQKLTDFERVEVWRKVRQNELRILIGTRNALFLPFQNLGLVIVDEEHDSAYRPREVSPYFNARDASLVFGSLYGARVILGSATPSVESYYLAKKDKLKYVLINERFGNVKLPSYEIINFKEAQESKKVTGNFSLKLTDEIKKTLDEHNQVMILHNRRGYANVVECETCGYVNYCSNCDVVMTYHKAANEMKCHYCGQRASKPRVCPKCHSENLNERGVGVEQIHEEVTKLFPDQEVDRMDVDSMRKKFAYEKLYEKIEARETDILVGTQMISKGLDFDHVELVAIPKADSMLYVQDFRAEERAYQLITQVSGRAGRVSGNGKIVIQTFNPEHSVFQLITMNDPSKIYEYFLDERKKFHYPPFTRLMMIELKHRKEDRVNRASLFLGSVLRKYLPEECVLGPERAQIAKLNNLYQFQIMLKLPRGKKYEKFKEMVAVSIQEFNEITAYQSVKTDVFVDY
ncbi:MULTISPECIES: replication restart helicase PriA [Chryseobacterium]|uniref:Replication restart protein PriA n=1 Tax=Chryseobacterium camelliae TaxID=1265445 RepID=A0ABU0THP2_9FLAO|nr:MULTISPECIES: primosomal protein N' [Chryseobacterium]MDT3409566.1 primosomal protein N' (replication factor Y) [Pseudacidovorax intermedius]MDQ1096572.1 primosomal protein N' (replication factor Y) [Chryseobacterium camelliae]MDQ1100513.1 primosomal protein N' (replication factor Y) [Chryseobacterium sp. SORGH_AS_1048]MDR6087853.1 primosomal protein N' (replication factor Y) [Chryseobacterium sp. SORGH_AS_0909]MDR6132229.1 primosomal protein N' (replication factor Y) [Chryseobacterium sp. 